MSRGPNGEHPYLLVKQARQAELERELAEVRSDIWSARRTAWLEAAREFAVDHPNAPLYAGGVAAAAVVGYVLGLA